MFDGLSVVVGAAVIRPYSAGWISTLYPIRWHRNCKVESSSHQSISAIVSFLTHCQLSTVNRQTDLVLFHVSAVGVPSWVIGQKAKYEQGNKE